MKPLRKAFVCGASWYRLLYGQLTVEMGLVSLSHCLFSRCLSVCLSVCECEGGCVFKRHNIPALVSVYITTRSASHHQPRTAEHSSWHARTGSLKNNRGCWAARWASSGRNKTISRKHNSAEQLQKENRLSYAISYPPNQKLASG
jgi:hypothetical protein